MTGTTTDLCIGSLRPVKKIILIKKSEENSLLELSTF